MGACRRDWTPHSRRCGAVLAQPPCLNPLTHLHGYTLPRVCPYCSASSSLMWEPLCCLLKAILCSVFFKTVLDGFVICETPFPFSFLSASPPTPCPKTPRILSTNRTAPASLREKTRSHLFCRGLHCKAESQLSKLLLHSPRPILHP